MRCGYLSFSAGQWRLLTYLIDLIFCLFVCHYLAGIHMHTGYSCLGIFTRGLNRRPSSAKHYPAYKLQSLTLCDFPASRKLPSLCG